MSKKEFSSKLKNMAALSKISKGFKGIDTGTYEGEDLNISKKGKMIEAKEGKPKKRMHEDEIKKPSSANFQDVDMGKDILPDLKKKLKKIKDSAY